MRRGGGGRDTDIWDSGSMGIQSVVSSCVTLGKGMFFLCKAFLHTFARGEAKWREIGESHGGKGCSMYGGVFILCDALLRSFTRDETEWRGICTSHGGYVRRGRGASSREGGGTDRVNTSSVGMEVHSSV